MRYKTGKVCVVHALPVFVTDMFLEIDSWKVIF